MNKVYLSGILAAAVLAAPLANAGNKHHNHKPKKHHGFHDYAQVVHVKPIVRHVRVSSPRQECWTEEVRQPVYQYRHKDSAPAMIAGGLIGGVVGNRFGEGRGNDAATLAGAVIGASIGHDMARQSGRVVSGYQTAYEDRCHTVNDYHTEERVEGYRVTYRYKGETFKTRLPYDPGHRMKVNVHVEPVSRHY